jgi:hypothetical protein
MDRKTYSYREHPAEIDGERQARQEESQEQQHFKETL